MGQTIKIVSPEQWLSALLDSHNAVSTSLPLNGGRFQVPTGWQVESVLPEDHLLYYVGDGGFTATVGGQRHDLRTGSQIWLMPNVPFTYHLPEGEELTLYRFRLRVVAHGALLRMKPDCVVEHGFTQGRLWYEKLIHDSQSAAPSSAVYARALLAGFFSELLAHSRAPASAQMLAAHQQHVIEQYVDAHIRRAIVPAELAEAAGLSADYFSRVFHKTYGMPPRKWIVQQRIRYAAARLAHSSLSVSEVAEEFGYRDLFFFSRQFKAVLGMSPVRYRRSNY